MTKAIQFQPANSAGKRGHLGRSLTRLASNLSANEAFAGAPGAGALP